MIIIIEKAEELKPNHKGLEMTQFLNDFETVSEYTNKITSPFQNLPVEIILIIFEYLSDNNRWNLACTSSTFMAVFRKYGHFDTIPIYFTNELSCLPSHVNLNPILETVKTKKFAQALMDDWVYAGTDESKIIAVKFLNQRQYYLEMNSSYGFVVFDESYDLSFFVSTSGYLDCSKTKSIAMIPLNDSSVNSFVPRAIRSSQEWNTIFKENTISGNIASHFIAAEFEVSHQTKKAKFFLGLNAQELNIHIRNGNEIPPYTKVAILQLVNRTAQNTVEHSRWDRPYKAITNLPAIDHPNLKGGVRLHEYQMAALAWMKNIEENCYTKEYRVCTVVQVSPSLNISLNVKPEPTLFYCSEENWKPVKPEEEVKDDDPQYSFSFTAKGGILADEMGLGKTMTVISLIVSNQRRLDPESKTYLPLCVPIEATALEVKPCIKTTLIICPSQLVAQWGKEIANNSTLTYKCCTQRPHYESADLPNYDVVIVSHNAFFQAKKAVNQQCDPCFQRFSWHRIVIDEAHQVLATVPKNRTAVPQCTELWSQIESSFNWYVSGTPVPLGRASVVGALRYLGVKVHGLTFPHYSILSDEAAELFYPLESLLFSSVKQHLFWRNTKESVKTEVEFSPLVEKIYYVQFTQGERILYDCAKALQKSEPELRRLCAIPVEEDQNEDNKISIDTTIDKTIVDVQDGINSCRANFYTHKYRIKEEGLKITFDELDAEYRQGKPSETDTPAVIEIEKQLLFQAYDKARSAYFNEAKQMEKAKAGLRNYYEAINYLSKMLNPIPCELCKQQIYYFEETPCGHKACTKCLTDHWEAKKGKPSCPTCNERVYKSQVLTVIPTRDSQYSGGVVSKHGSKLVAICGYLQSVMASTGDIKAIVFSQYESTLARLTKMLSTLDPVNFTNQIVSCKGNIHMRRKVIDAFNSQKKGSPRILLLSLANNASGTHLPVATHIVLVDPVVGTQENAKALDSQAIARAHRIGQNRTVVAVRFIVKDSIEQDDYQSAYGPIQSGELSTFTLEEKSRTAAPQGGTEGDAGKEELTKKPKRSRGKKSATEEDQKPSRKSTRARTPKVHDVDSDELEEVSVPRKRKAPTKRKSPAKKQKQTE